MNLGMSEIILILVVALVVIGPKRLPDVAKSVGKGYGEFKKVFNDMKKSVDVGIDDEPASRASRPAQSTYKSRWEEQTAPENQAQLTEATPVEAVDAQEDTGTTPQVVETPRAKRGDLVKEDENGNG